MNKLNAICKSDDRGNDLLISCHLHGRKIGWASVTFFEDSTVYPSIGITVPAKTAVYGATEVIEGYRNYGLGVEMLKIAEKESLERGMKHLQVPMVQNHRFFIKNGFYYTGRQRIFEKKLPERSLTIQQKKRTEEYLTHLNNLHPTERDKKGRFI